MKFYDYLPLSDEKQWDAICDKGIEIATVSDFEFKYTLYAIVRFFVEISYLKVTDERLEKNAFIEGERMEKYVGEIGV